MTTYLLLCAAGFLAGAMNALAGGGSFVSLPALIVAGVPSVAANASSTVALWPGGAASVWVYRDGLGQVVGVPLLPTFLTTLIGGFLGALLLLWTPSNLFDQVLPWLLLIATLVLAFGPRLGPWVRNRFSAGIVTVLSIQFVLGVYGGYFGGAVGLMMLAVWSLLGGADIKALNPSRALMSTSANTIATLIFALSGIVYWPELIVMGIGALAGGYGGAHLGRRLPPVIVRGATILLACTVTVVFFVRAYR